MTEPAFTPWEWKRVKGEGAIAEWSLHGPKDVLCRFWHDVPLSDEARLIAAAPDLYEALEAICDELLNGGTEQGAHLIARHGGRHALAKATGEQSHE